MSKLIHKITWYLDYYFVYFLYNPRKRQRYHKMMLQKWGEKYSNKK